MRTGEGDEVGDSSAGGDGERWIACEFQPPRKRANAHRETRLRIAAFHCRKQRQIPQERAETGADVLAAAF